MSDSQLFQTALRNPVAPDFDCAVRVVDPKASKIVMPRHLSPRIANRDLVESLKRDTSLRVPSSPRARYRARAPAMANGESPRFHALPSLTNRNRPPTDISQATENALNDPTSIPNDIEVLRLIASELRGQRDHIGDTGDYKEAHRYQKTLQAVERKLEYEESHEGEMNNVQEMMTRHQEIEAVVASYQREWDKNFEEFLRTTEQDQAELQARHEQELEEYDQTVPTEISQKYAKRSPRLLAMRVKEARLALTKQYAAAEKLKVRGDKEEERESEGAMDKTYGEWMSQRERMIEAQEKEMEAFIEHAEANRRLMVMSRDKRLSGYLRRMSLLDKHIDLQCGALKIKDRDLDNGELDEERAEFVLEQELKTPIPAFRSGTTFTTSRQRTRSAPRARRQRPAY